MQLTEKPTEKPWVGFDLDGTLAIHPHEQDIGPPVPAIKEKLLKLINAGVRVKIFTARAGDAKMVADVYRWMMNHGIPYVEITDRKDFHMIACYDARAHRVEPNSGVVSGNTDTKLLQQLGV